MNVIRLMGGIGNQMFQYAFGRVFEQRGIDVIYDLIWYKQYLTSPASKPFPRIYKMDKFRVEMKFGHFISSYKTVKEEGYNDKIFELDRCNFDGYWQHLRYYVDILPILKEEFLLKDEMKTQAFHQLASEIKSLESIGVHVRRGDYLELWSIMSVNYYGNAIQRTQGDLYVFSDDMPWCRRAFRQEYLKRKITFVDIEDYLAFELMRLCRQKILGNSTFSWWAAFLGDNGLVICPKGWLGFKNTFEEDERYPKEWIRLDN